MNTEDPIVIIQGPVYGDGSVVRYYSKYIQNCRLVISTWLDEKQKINCKNNVEVVATNPPENKGYMNCNLQCLSVAHALESLHGVKPDRLVIKVRSDLVVRNFSKFLKRVEGLHALDPSTLIHVAKCTFGKEYFTDYIVAGSYRNMKEFWHPSSSSEMGMPFPEQYLIQRYTGELGKYNGKLVDATGIDFFWLKYRKNLKWSSRFIKFNDRLHLARLLALYLIDLKNFILKKSIN